MSIQNHSIEAWSVVEFCRAHGIGRSTVFREIADGRLHPLYVGRKIIITRANRDAWLKNLDESPQTEDAVQERSRRVKAIRRGAPIARSA